MQQQDPRIGKKIGSLKVVEISGGGMGDLLLCVDPEGGKHVLKHVRSDAPGFRELSDREAFTHAALPPAPHVVSSTFVLREHDDYYLGMEHIDGINLENYLFRNPSMALRDVSEMALQIAYGIHTLLHGGRLVHLDLKPGNVLRLPDGTLKVCDLGVARVVGRPSDGLGTLGYMPPEQQEGAPADPRMDVYAFGAVCYEMLCGRRPYTIAEETDPQPGARTLYARVQSKGPPPPPDRFRPDVPERFRKLILSCLEPRPESRPRDIDELEPELIALYEHLGGAVSAEAPFDLWRQAAERGFPAEDRRMELHVLMRTSRHRREKRPAHPDLVQRDRRDVGPVPPGMRAFCAKVLSQRNPAQAYPPNRLPYEKAVYAANALLYSKGPAAALPYWRYLAALSSDDSYSWWVVAQGYMELGDPSRALQAIDQVLSINPTNGRMWHRRGGFHSLRGNPGEAARSYEEALRCDYTYVKAWTDRGLELEKVGRKDDALLSLRQAARLAPSDERVRRTLAGMGEAGSAT